MGTTNFDRLQVGGNEVGGNPVPFEANFDWNQDKFPLRLFRDRRGQYSTDFNARTDVASIKAIFDGVTTGATGVYYANRAAANDAGSGLTEATAKQSVRSAIALGEADGTKTNVLVYVANGDYDRTTDMLGTAGTPTPPSKPTVLVGWGGTPIISPTVLGLSFSADAGDATGKTWKATRSNVTRVINKTAVDSFGDPNLFAKIASAAAVYASSGSDVYFTDNTSVWIKRGDGNPVTDVNTRILLVADCCRIGTKSFYASGIDFMGGGFGVLQANTAGNYDVVAEDCGFMAPAIDGGTGQNCVTADFDGLLALVRPRISKANADAINPHGFNGRLHYLIIGGYGRDIGRNPNLSCNDLTGHENTIGISIGHDGNVSAGGQIRIIGTSKICVLGGSFVGDRGDIAFGGTVQSTAVMVDDTAECWLYETTLSRSQRSLFANGAGSKIHVRAGSLGGGSVGGTGTIDTF